VSENISSKIYIYTDTMLILGFGLRSVFSTDLGFGYIALAIRIGTYSSGNSCCCTSLYQHEMHKRNNKGLFSSLL
jgi:hypothetical protein